MCGRCSVAIEILPFYFSGGGRVVEVEWNYEPISVMSRGRGGRGCNIEVQRASEEMEQYTIGGVNTQLNGFAAQPGDFPMLCATDKDSAVAGRRHGFRLGWDMQRSGRFTEQTGDFPPLGSERAAVRMERRRPEPDFELLTLQTKGMRMIDDDEQEGA